MSKKPPAIPKMPCRVSDLPPRCAYQLSGEDIWRILSFRIGGEGRAFSYVIADPRLPRWNRCGSALTGIDPDCNVQDACWPYREAPVMGTTEDPLAK